MTTTYELTITPHWSQYNGPRPTSGHGAIETHTFDSEQSAHEAMIEHGFNAPERRKLLAGHVLSVGGWRYALKTVVTEPTDEPRTVTLGELTSRLGLPDHDQSAVLAWTNGDEGLWTESEVAELIAAWHVDKARIIAEDVAPAPIVEPAASAQAIDDWATMTAALEYDAYAAELRAELDKFAKGKEPYPTDEPARGDQHGAVTLDVLLSAVRACERDLGRARGVGSISRATGVNRTLDENLYVLRERMFRARTLAAAGASGADVLRVLDGIEPTSLPAGVTIRNARDFDDHPTDEGR